MCIGPLHDILETLDRENLVQDWEVPILRGTQKSTWGKQEDAKVEMQVQAPMVLDRNKSV